MDATKEKDSKDEYEEMVMVVDIPTHVHMAKKNSKVMEDSFIQILGMSSDKPIVKVKNQILAGSIVNTLGSDLLFEVETKKETKPKKVDGEACTKKIKDLIVTEKRFSMNSIFLEPKSGSNEDKDD